MTADDQPIGRDAPPSTRALETVARRVAHGGVVLFPTETVYGIGASVTASAAIQRIYQIKNRPPTQPLIVHVRDHRALERFGKDLPSCAHALAQAFWPGPLTLVVSRHERLDASVTGGGPTVGIRAPDHPATLALLTRLEALEGHVAGLAGTSANVHGQPPPTRFSDLAAALERATIDGASFAQIDGGDCSLGVESTVLALTGPRPRILRHGGVSLESLAAALGCSLHDIDGAAPPIAAPKPVPQSPGATAGRAHIVSFSGKPPAAAMQADAWLIIRAAPASMDSARVIALGASIEAFGRGLYDALARARRSNARAIYVERMPDEGLGRAINARLDRFGHRA